MFNLLDRLEQMGKPGGRYALSIAAGCFLVAIALFGGSFWLGDGLWGPGLIRGLAFILCSFSLIFGMVGARILTARVYPSAESLFPSLSKEDFVRAIHDEPRPICVCVRCLIHLPAQFSTGGCPRCASSVDYYEIQSDEDAEMVLLAIP